jgi:hypothetical protein
MKTMYFDVHCALALQKHGKFAVLWCLAVGLCLGTAVGCGTEEARPLERERGVMGGRGDGSEMGEHGLSVNGLSVNGLSVNGLSVNGLSVNGLQTASFRGWFEQDPGTRESVMRYVVMCALPEGQSRTYQSPAMGLTYVWPGRLGLALEWGNGMPATVAEQQVITACLAAHANKFGLHIGISVLGLTAQGTAMPYTSWELATYSEREACFFGNAFTEQGLYVANDRNVLNPKESTTRACGLSSKKQSIDCPPLVHVGSCKDFCTLDSTKTFYTQCTYQGVKYKPLTTRILPEDIYGCGDGVCQFTESCGTGSTYDSCKADCGECR